MPYCFEMRFHTPRPLSPWTDRLEKEFAAASFKQPLQLYRPHGMNTQEGWLAVKSCGYADQGEAEASGALLRDGLLIVAAKQKVGVEFYLRGAANPIYAYSGQMELSDPGLPLPTILTNDELKEMMGAAVESAASLTANQLLSF